MNLINKIHGNLRDMVFRRNETEKDMTTVQMLTHHANVFVDMSTDFRKHDLIQSAIQPYIDHIGKLSAKHMRDNDEYPEPHIRRLLTYEANERMSFQALIEKTLWELFFTGNAFIYIDFDWNDNPSKLHLLQPTTAEILRDNRNAIYLRFYFGDGTTRVLPYTSIIHLRRKFDSHDFFGSNPAESLQGIIDTVNTTDRGLKNAIKNSAIIRWIVSFTQSMRDDDIKAKVKEISETFMDIEGEGIAGQDAKYKIEQVGNQNQFYLPDNHIQKLLAVRINNFFGVSEPIINSNYTEEEFQAWFEGRCSPIIRQLSDEFTRKIFSRRERDFRNEIVFEGENLLFSTMKTKLELIAVVDRGGMSLNEYRAILGLPPLIEDRFVLRREYGSLNEVAGGDTTVRDENDNIVQYEPAQTVRQAAEGGD